MATYNIMSWNIRGLNSKYKRSLMWIYLKRHSPSILLLQETHLVGQKTLALKKSWVGWTYHASFSTYSRGVSILVRKNLPFELSQIISDHYGRYILIACLLANKPLILANIYMPPPFTITLLQHIGKKLADLPPAPLCIMGDMNQVMDLTKDRLHSNIQGPTNLAQWANSLGLSDIWRWKHPLEKAYSCHSLPHKSFSRIDIALATADILPLVEQISYLPQHLSDHSPLLLRLQWLPNTIDRLWRLSPLWLKHPDIASSSREAYIEYWEFNTGTAPQGIVWDASKAATRGSLTALISHARKKSKESITKAEEHLAETQRNHFHNPTTDTYEEVRRAEAALARESTIITKKALLYKTQHIFDKGDKNSKILAILAKQQQASTAVSRIQTETGNIVHEPYLIAGTFASYYQKLYSSTATYTAPQLRHFLDSIHIPKLSPTERAWLNAPITLEEITTAIQSLPSNKTPGLDGLPPDWYKALNDLVTPQLLTTLQSAWDSQSLPPSFAEALIVVIPKAGRDPTLCSSYRPISLINTDAKILAKVLATRLTRAVQDLIHPDQSGFMPGRATDFNLRRLFTNLQITHTNSGARAVASLDSEKAFDSIEWEYLWEVLRRFGLGARFIQWLKMLYKHPIARVRVNNTGSPAFSLHRGTRQGCPLSPTLFALAIEPLAITIRNNPNIKGLNFANVTEKVSLFADDILIYLADSGTSLSTLLETIQTFGKYSGLKVNWDKSQLYHIDPAPVAQAIPNTPLKEVMSFKYLGIQVHTDPNTFRQLNLDPLIDSLSLALKNWEKLPLSLWGRVNIIKMIYLPKLLYILHNTPYAIPRAVFKKLNTIMNPFIWANKPPRISWEKLTSPIGKGGLGLPHFYFYYLTSQIYYLHWCFAPNPYNPNMPLQASILHSLEGLGTYPYRHVSDMTALPDVLKTPHQAWTTALKLLGCPLPYPSPHLPLWKNSLLQQLYDLPDVIYWARLGIKKLSDLLLQDQFPTLQNLQERIPGQRIQLYRYLQLRHAFQAQFHSLSLTQETTPLEEALYSPTPKKLLSNLYKMVMESLPPPFNRARQLWHQAIPNLQEDQWEEAIDTAYDHLISIKDRLIQYKSLHQIYITPLKLLKIGKRQNDLCPRCDTPGANFIHMIWACPPINRFWKDVMGTMAQELGTPQIIDPVVCLLGVIDDILPTNAARIRFRTLMFYAKKTVIMHWMGNNLPSLNFWRQLVDSALPLIKLTYETRGAMDKFERVWSDWCNPDPQDQQP
uniref:Reverse transcriptase domain-containing protein n=1 Tax=Xenopus tropicalis TaxID=8364 RepID=A0A803KF69_XENTR